MDRYIRLSLDGDGRTVLPTTLLTQLDAADGGVVRLVVRNDRLWVWSEVRWRALQQTRVEALLAAMEHLKPAVV
jgi:DNA-binding transcriptional regulator/RsmH inhibitor MraZ